jgi:hypothetical protein
MLASGQDRAQQKKSICKFKSVVLGKMQRDGVDTIRRAAPAKCFTDLAELTDNVAILDILL